ncbi:hypothetical protein F4809DRAFT_604731 [Biscogniauxia mediterranea]|nr:hypothetical protein F4809DRAFT_604731 [Biscogniauxia mediterranea]
MDSFGWVFFSLLFFFSNSIYIQRARGSGEIICLYLLASLKREQRSYLALLGGVHTHTHTHTPHTHTQTAFLPPSYPRGTYFFKFLF